MEIMNSLRMQRRAEAEKRNALRSNLTPKQQLQILDLRLGNNVGAYKERKRLHAQISSS